MSKIKLILILTIFAVVKSEIPATCWTQNKQCLGRLIRVSIESDRATCVDKCQKNGDCKWVSYNAVDHSCHFNQACYTTMDRDGSQFASADCNGIPYGIMTVYGACDDPQCDPPVEITPLESGRFCVNPPEIDTGFSVEHGFGGMTGCNERLIPSGCDEPLIPTICGGIIKGFTQPTYCYELQDGEWQKTRLWDELRVTQSGFTQLTKKRGVLFSGGKDKSGSPLKTASIFQGESMIQLDDMPNTVFDHCIVELTEDNFMVIGGTTEAQEHESRTWSYAQVAGRDEWKRGPDLKVGRRLHSCAVLTEDYGARYVVVVGGENSAYELFLTTEIAKISNDGEVADFEEGPSLPISGVKEAQLLSLPFDIDKSGNLDKSLDNSAELQYAITRGLLLIGGMDKYSTRLTTIYRLESVFGTWQRSDKLSLQTPRHRHISFLVTYESLVCKE